ncbi:MAG: hypothetical protein KIT58_02975 [Planctomycetota bacterium]|nr:hypothetical protein [Planctomycetota bacterium]
MRTPAGCLPAAPPFPSASIHRRLAARPRALESVVARGGFDPADYAARIAAIFAERRIVGSRARDRRGGGARLARGVPWDQAGTPAPAAGSWQC